MKSICNREYLILELFYKTWSDKTEHEEEKNKINEVFVQYVSDSYTKRLLSEEERDTLLKKIS